MASRVVRLVLIANAMCILPGLAVASPILELAPMVAPGKPVPGGQVLDEGSWAVLDARDDHGWHLGWFKRKKPSGGDGVENTNPNGGGGGLGYGGTPTGSDGSGSTTGEPNGWIPVATDPVDGVPPNSLFPHEQSGSALPAADDTFEVPAILSPEPTSLVLLGSGLLVLARRRRRTSSVHAD